MTFPWACAALVNKPNTADAATIIEARRNADAHVICFNSTPSSLELVETIVPSSSGACASAFPRFGVHRLENRLFVARPRDELSDVVTASTTPPRLQLLVRFELGYGQVYCLFRRNTARILRQQIHQANIV